MITVPIKDTSFVRDIKNNAILNVNVKELDEFNKRRNKIIAEKVEKEETKKRLSEIEQDIKIIHNLLQELIHLRTNHGN